MKYSGCEVDDGSYSLANGVTLNVWTEADGAQWACLAHGPATRCLRCHALYEAGREPYPDMTAALLSLVIEGTLNLSDGPTDWQFVETEAGRRRVETAARRGGFEKGLDA